MKVEERKLKKDIEDIIKKIEDEIVYAINKDYSLVELSFGDGVKRDTAWEVAIVQLKRFNKEYNFELKSISFKCDNFIEAANVDGVLKREWWESRWQLEVTW